MTNEEKQWLKGYVKELLKAKYTTAEMVRMVELNGISKTTARNYIKDAQAEKRVRAK